MTELIDSIKETFKQRIKNPIIGSFVISWIAVNWKAISFFILSNSSIEQKIKFIEANYSSYWTNLFIPLIVSFLYTSIIPYFVFLSDYLSRVGYKLRKNILKRNQLDDIENKIQIASKEVELEDERSRHKDKIDLNNKIQFLNDLLSTKEVEIKELEKSLLKERDEKVLLLSSMNEFDFMEQNEMESLNDEKQKIIIKELEVFKRTEFFKYFSSISKGIIQNGKIDHNIPLDVIDSYLEQDLITELPFLEDDLKVYILTTKAKFFRRELRLEEIRSEN